MGAAFSPVKAQLPPSCLDGRLIAASKLLQVIEATPIVAKVLGFQNQGDKGAAVVGGNVGSGVLRPSR